MKLQTIVPLPKSNVEIAHHNRIFSIGSCFAENIAEKLAEFKFEIISNPFGIVYNPVSLLKQMLIIFEKENYDYPLYINERYVSTSFHSNIADINKSTFHQKVTAKAVAAKHYLQSTDVVIITFGTAWVYEQVDTQKIVANCHKIPSRQFNKRLLSVDEAKQAILELKHLLLQINPHIKFIFTISPVRHIRDGFTENHQSKGILHLALNQALSNEDVYFPAYEIMLDELRDYRFYDNDFLHPNTLAINYIWEKFSTVFFNENTVMLNKKIKNIVKGLAHRPFLPNSEQYKLFRKKLDADIALLPPYIQERF